MTTTKKANLSEQYNNESIVELQRQSISTGYGGIANAMDVIYLEEIGNFLTKQTALLDVACGEGDFLLSEICQAKSSTSKLSVRPKQVFAVDNSAASIKAFRNQLDQLSKPEGFPEIQLFKHDVTTIGELNLPSCDLIVSRYALNHMHSLDEMTSCFGQLKSILKSDGHLVVLVNAYETAENPSTFKKLERGNLVPIKLYGDVPFTVPGYSISEFVFAFHAAGFTVKKLVARDGWKSVIQDKYHDGEPFPREGVTPLTIAVSCVPS